jgi:hypothetical protein
MMSRIVYLVSFLLLSVTLHAQDLIPRNPVDRFDKSTHDSHTHIDGVCSTIEILRTPEAILAQEEFLRWDRSGRPGWHELKDALIAMTIGERKNFFTYNFETSGYESKEFELRAIGEKAVIWVERAEFAPNKVSDEKIAELMRSLETSTPANSIDSQNGIVVNNRRIFGNAPNVDGSGRVSVLLTNIPVRENGLTTGGYFTSVNLSQTNSNSNRADIIYINTSLIYNPNRSVNLDGALSTLAHEDQHLIHASFGTLSTFLNEGQSEWAEIANGYDVRPASNLQTTQEVNRQLFTWRSGQTEVLFDYARAGLFHSYVAERVGPEATGTITRSGRNGVEAYNRALTGSGISFEELLIDFHTANLVNNAAVGSGNYVYRAPGRASMRTSGFASEYPSYLVDVASSGSVAYGGAEIIQWTGVEDFTITINSDNQVKHRLIGKSLNTAQISVIDINSGQAALTGQYESVQLISAKVQITGATELNEGPGSYSYSANWQPLPVERERISYHKNSAFYAELPGEQSDPARRDIARYATRFNSTITGIINQIGFAISGNALALRGSGTLKISLHTNIQNGFDANPDGGQNFLRFEPGLQLREKYIDIRTLSRGSNVVLLDGEDWQVQRNSEYWVVFEVLDASPDARVEFLIDAGSTNYSDSDYFPTRSRVFVRNSPATGVWARWSNSNNYLVNIQVTGLYEGTLDAPVFTTSPQSQYRPFYGSDFSVNVAASGTPTPIYIWTKDGQLFRTGPSSVLNLPSITEENSGVYSVRAANYAGYTEPISFIVDVVPPEFNLTQNYPNPFNNATTIGFSVAEDGFVAIDVYDITGRWVATLTRSNRLFRKGFHEVSLDADQLSSGVYVYNMRFTPSRTNGERFTETRKMLLVR